MKTKVSKFILSIHHNAEGGENNKHSMLSINSLK